MNDSCFVFCVLNSMINKHLYTFDIHFKKYMYLSLILCLLASLLVDVVILVYPFILLTFPDFSGEVAGKKICCQWLKIRELLP